MRIDAYNQITQLYGAQTTLNAQNKTNRASMSNDQLSISTVGYSHQMAKNAVSEASDVRMDKVARIKAQIQAGTYSVDTADLAAKLMGNYQAVM